MIDFVQIIEPGGLLGRLLELHLSDPRQVALRPRRHRRGRATPVAQQEFSEPMARAQLILLRRLPGAHQIAEGLVRGVRHPDGR